MDKYASRFPSGANENGSVEKIETMPLRKQLLGFAGPVGAHTADALIDDVTAVNRMTK